MGATNLVRTVVDGFERLRFIANSTEKPPPQEGIRRPAPGFMFRRNGVLGRWNQSVFITFLLLAHPWAERARAQEPIARLADLLALASERNPQLHAAQQRWEAMTKVPRQAGSLPDPAISVRNFGVGHPFSALNTSNFAFVSLGLSQQIPFPGKRRLRSDMAREAALAEKERYRQLELDVLSQVKTAYYDYFYFTKALETVARTRDLMLSFEKITVARYSVGKGLQQDVLRAQLELTGLREREEIFRQHQGSAQAEINVLVDRAPGALLGSPEQVEQAPFPAELTELYQQMQHNSPVLREREHQVDHNALAVDLSRKNYFPDMRAGFEWQHTGSMFRDYYVAAFEVRVPLYFWRKQRFGAEEASARLIESRRSYRAATQELLFQAKDQLLQARASDRLLSLYKTALIPQTMLTLESAISSYEVGSVDFLTLMNAAIVLLDYELQSYRQLAAYQKALASLEPIVGVTLIP